MKQMFEKVFSIIIIMLIITMVLLSTNSYAETRNNNPLLIDIQINGEPIKPEFDQFIADYVFAVDENVEKLNIEAVPDDPNAKVEIIGDTNLKKGKNDIEIKVTAEDTTTTKSYYLHVTRGNQQKANANLRSLEVKGYDLNPSFNEKDINYLVQYTDNIEKLDIIAIPENENAQVEIIGNENYSSTIHIVEIHVKAEDGITEKIYKLTVKKAEEEVENPSGKETQEQVENIEKKESEAQGNIAIYILILVLIVVIIVIFGKSKMKN